jgi:hypothetical protein
MQCERNMQTQADVGELWRNLEANAVMNHTILSNSWAEKNIVHSLLLKSNTISILKSIKL